MVKTLLGAGIAAVIMMGAAGAAEAHTVVKTKVVNPPGPGVYVSKQVVHTHRHVRPVRVVATKRVVRPVVVRPAIIFDF